MNLKTIAPEEMRYYANAKNLIVNTRLISSEKEMEELHNLQSYLRENDTEFICNFIIEELDYTKPILVRCLYFKCNGGQKTLLTLNTVYMTNDEGKTIERIN